MGDDASEYEEDFELKMGDSGRAYKKLIALMDFVSNSSDVDFAEDLWSYIDQDSFITMIALDELLHNTDSFSGMGSNYYLYYSLSEEKFYILSWDQNLAIIGMGGGK